jgi:NitT/TauT family transport system permease protein
MTTVSVESSDSVKAMSSRLLAHLVRKAGPAVLTGILTLVLWQLTVRWFAVSELLVPAPSTILLALVHYAPLLYSAALSTLKIIAFGFGLACLVGILVALALVRFPVAFLATYPIVVLFQTVPKVALAPIFVIWFGYGITPKLLLIVVISFFPITLNLIAGLRAVDPNLLLLMRSVGCSPTETLMRVMVPSALPHLFAGLKIAVTFAVIGAIVAEFAGSTTGLGYLIQFGSTQMDAPLMFASLIIVSAMGVVLYYFVALIEWVIVPWSERLTD